jgi:hypothetical protein
MNPVHELYKNAQFDFFIGQPPPPGLSLAGFSHSERSDFRGGAQKTTHWAACMRGSGGASFISRRPRPKKLSQDLIRGQ